MWMSEDLLTTTFSLNMFRVTMLCCICYSKNTITLCFHCLSRSILGGFIDNHDHERFLYKNPSYTALRNNLVYIFMSKSIPILYYGTEQGFNGGNDPYCRESLWPYMNKNHVLYTFIERLIQVRKSQGKNWLYTPQIERHVDAQVYAFSRQHILVVITTESLNTTRVIQSHPFQMGDTVHNLLDVTQKFTISKKGELTVMLHSGEPLILAKAGMIANSVIVIPVAMLYSICCILSLAFQCL